MDAVKSRLDHDVAPGDTVSQRGRVMLCVWRCGDEMQCLDGTRLVGFVWSMGGVQKPTGGWAWTGRWEVTP